MDQRLIQSAKETIRNVAIQVPLSLGPFNALTIPGRSLETAFYLAYGIRGWWKTEEASSSLLGVIRMQNSDNRLLSASSFEQSIFQAVEAENPFYGATITDEENGGQVLQSTPMPVNPNTIGQMDRATLCVRALTSGLLCLFKRSEVFEILFVVLQKCLIHFQQTGTAFQRHGPFSTALKKWIDAIRTQESFRGTSAKCMEQLDTAAKVVSNVSMRDLQNTQYFDSELVIAFLQWLVTEEVKHDEAVLRDYPTRSFHVWSLAFILNKLGFLVEASTTAIQDQQMWEDQMSQSIGMSGPWRVHLVTSNSVFADHAYNHRPSSRVDFCGRRIVPIGTLPIVLFDNFKCYDSPDLDLNVLNEIFLSTFDDVKNKLLNYRYLRALAGLGDEIDEAQGSQRVVLESQLTTYQQQKIEDWVDHPGIAQLLQNSISSYIPSQCPDNCGKKRCYYAVVPFEDTGGHSEESMRWRQELRKDHIVMSPWIKMHVIMLAFAYAVACNFIITENNKRADLDTQVSWKPIQFFDDQMDWTKVRIVIPDGDLRIWVRTLSDALKFHLEPLDLVPTETWPPHRRLKGTLFSMICGIQNEVIARDQDNRDTITDFTLGCSANGLTLISKALLNPTVDASTLHLYHVCFGRILELPVNSVDLIEGCSPQKRPARVLKYSPSTSRIFDSVIQDEDVLAREVRWDAEPDWAVDFMKVCVCCRIDGLPRGIFNPLYLSRKSCASEDDPERCRCTCSSPKAWQSITFPKEEYWIEYHLREFYDAGAVFNQNFKTSNLMNPGETRYIFVRAGTQARNQLAALDMMLARASNKADLVVRKILSSCLTCAAERARRRPSHWTSLFRGQMGSKKFINFIVLSM